VGGALIFATMSYSKADIIMILATCLNGSYLAIRGVSFYLKNYPNEFEIYDLIKAGAYKHIPTVFYYYLGGFVVLSLIGGAFQGK